MTEDGTLSIVRHGNTYQVRYASNNPHGMDEQLYTDLSQETLQEMLQQCGMDPWYITQAMVELRKGRCAVLPMIFADLPYATQCLVCATPRNGERGTLRAHGTNGSS